MTAGDLDKTREKMNQIQETTNVRSTHRRHLHFQCSDIHVSERDLVPRPRGSGLGMRLIRMWLKSGCGQIVGDI